MHKQTSYIDHIKSVPFLHNIYLLYRTMTESLVEEMVAESLDLDLGMDSLFPCNDDSNESGAQRELLELEELVEIIRQNSPVTSEELKLASSK